MNKVKAYLKNKKILLLSLLLILFIGVSFAYVIAQISGGATGNVNISADTTDNLKFSVDKEIDLNPTQFNVTEGGSGLSDQATGTASLVANSTNKTATFNYYVYFRINSNNYVYTTPEKTPEIVLTITNPLGEEITSLSGLNYVTATNADGSTVTGFDITTADDLYNVASLYEISSSSSTNPTIQNWTFKVTFINLETNQHENGGKSLNAEIILSRNVIHNDVVMTAYSNGISFNHPTPANYTVTTDCSVGSAEWNYKTWGLDIDFSGVGKAKCNVNYTEKEEKTYLNDYIISLSGQTQGTGQVVNENGYRYEGKNPNNYIWFNNELWRIIGVFDSASHGQSGQNLVKIIRKGSIGGLCWSKGYRYNTWNLSNLKILLNGAYYDWDINKSSVSSLCYGNSGISSNCDYSEIGINDAYRNMIQNVAWYQGRTSSTSETAASFYEHERGSVGYTDYIGLMYPSDYGYSVLSTSCARTINLDSYNSSSCAGQSWLNMGLYEWTMTSSSSSIDNYVFSLDFSGNLSDNLNMNSGLSVRPVLYLSSSVYKIKGDGTISNPYIIGM